MSFELHSFAEIKTVRVEPADARKQPHLPAVIFCGMFHRITIQNLALTLGDGNPIHTNSNVNADLWEKLRASNAWVVSWFQNLGETLGNFVSP